MHKPQKLNPVRVNFCLNPPASSPRSTDPSLSVIACSLLVIILQPGVQLLEGMEAPFSLLVFQRFRDMPTHPIFRSRRVDQRFERWPHTGISGSDEQIKEIGGLATF